MIDAVRAVRPRTRVTEPAAASVVAVRRPVGARGAASRPRPSAPTATPGLVLPGAARRSASSAARRLAVEAMPKPVVTVGHIGAGGVAVQVIVAPVARGVARVCAFARVMLAKLLPLRGAPLAVVVAFVVAVPPKKAIARCVTTRSAIPFVAGVARCAVTPMHTKTTSQGMLCPLRIFGRDLFSSTLGCGRIRLVGNRCSGVQVPQAFVNSSTLGCGGWGGRRTWHTPSSGSHHQDRPQQAR